MMKQYLFLIAFFIAFFSNINAQVSVGSNAPNSSASLDIDVSTLVAKKGLLLPRVSLLNNTDVTTIPSPATGLLVYNLANNGIGNAAVVADMFYFWDGVQWTNLTNLTEVKRELLPQVFFIAESNNLITTPQQTLLGSDNVNTEEVIVKFSAGSLILNTGNNLLLNSNNTISVVNKGTYEVSGFINYNPNINDLSSSTNLEFIIQVSTDTGNTWSNVAKTVGVWGAGTTLNSRSNNIAPVIVGLNKDDIIRCVVLKTKGANHTTFVQSNGNTAYPQISAPTGLQYGKVLKIQKIK